MSLPSDKLERVISIWRQAEFRIPERHPSVSPQSIKRIKHACIDLAKRTARSPVPLAVVLNTTNLSSEGPRVFSDPDPYITTQASLPHDQKLFIEIDTNGCELSTWIAHWEDMPNWSEDWTSAVSEEDESIVFHVHSGSLRIFDKGTSIESIPDVFRGNYPFAAKSNRHRHVHEFVQAVRDHFAECVQYERVVSYWDNRAGRRFVGGPEKLFQKHLRYYLDLFLLDHRRVDTEYCPDGLTDRTDVWIETIHDEHYLLEIKWLGRSRSNNYGPERAFQGANQVIEYLERFPRIKHAALVLYDGRSENVEIPWSENEQHPRLDLSLRLYIISDTASQIGHRSS